MHDDRVLYRAGDRSYDTNELAFIRPVMLSFTRRETAGRPEELFCRHPYVNILYFESGNGILETGGSRYPIHTNDLFMINSGQPYRFYNEISNIPLVSYSFLVGNLSILGRSPEEISDDGFVSYSFRSPGNEVNDCIKLLNKALSEKGYSYHTKADALFTLLMADIVGLFVSLTGFADRDKPPAFAGVMQEARDAIDARFMSKDFTLKQLANGYGLIKRDFLVQFKTVFRKSAQRYLEGLRLDRAKSLLAQSGTLTLHQISVMSGFVDEVELTRAFKRLTGVTLKSFLDFETDCAALSADWRPAEEA
ncbi:MAG: AraC family transcriptional regulator [Clostridiales bacterium]|jgi:AraC-like DNA-binding protein|nr:AraC family transcriptional regulator [Clostridiales bacterium]